MGSVIPTGSSVLVEFGAAGPALGDIVLADIGPHVVVHRVVDRPVVGGRRMLVLKGDAEPRADPRIDREAVYGVIRAMRRGPRTTTVGCAGTPAVALAISSRVAGRLGERLARRGRQAPRPLRAMLRPALLLSAAPVRVSMGLVLALRALERGGIR
jgi:hypothetical protein